MKWLWQGLLLLCVAGCGPLVQRAPVPALHDLGSTREPLTVGVVLRDIEVTAPTWLDGSAMHYRLAYESATRRDVYAYSRWAAAPSEMLAVALKRMLAGDARPAPACRLRVEIDEFIHQYDHPDSSRALVSGRASLIDAAGRRVLASFAFNFSEAAASADAPGGVAATVRAVDGLGARIAEWLDSPAVKDRRDGC
jgi:cholesterol transport system auxiliary component